MEVLGFCFLIYDKIHLEELWHNWFKNVDKAKYKIYIHYKNNIKLKYFEEYKLDNCIETKYAHVTLIHAHNLLFKQAYVDGCSKIISLSQSCIPFKSFDYVYTFLTKDNLSHFNICPNQRGVFPRCNNALKYYDKKNIQKTSNWVILNRKIASVVCFNTVDDINEVWENIRSPEEHYFISEVFKNDLTSEIITTPNLASGATTFTNWPDMDYPYQGHSNIKNYNVIITEEINYLLNQPCLFGRKFNAQCTVNEDEDVKKATEGITQYLTKVICQ